MDTRTESQKLYETALRSERRTIGHRMSRKVLVIAPDHRRAQEWAHSHGIAFSDVVYVGPSNYDVPFRGLRGVEHVILGWYGFTDMARGAIKSHLRVVESPPFESEDADVVPSADPVWG